MEMPLPHWSTSGAAQSGSCGVLTDRPSQLEEHFKSMGGPARLVINGTPEKQLDLVGIAGQVRTLLEALAPRYSRYRPESIVSVINRRAGSGLFT